MFLRVSLTIMLTKLDVSQPNVTPRNLSRQTFPAEIFSAVLDENTGELLEYQHLMHNPKYRELWDRSYGNELGCLAQGMPGRVEGTNTIFFVSKEAMPTAQWRDVTYGSMIVKERPEKVDPNRTRLTVGRDKVNYPSNCSTLTVDLLIDKLLLNIVVSTPDTKFMTIDIKDFYLNTSMD